MGIWKNRKGVSPLIATVVLIGFAVSIGAVIMNWGKSAIEDATAEPETTPTDNLAWYMGNNVEGICYTADSISFTLKGSPKINIGSVVVSSKGRQDFVLADPISFPANENENSNVRIPYDSIKYGDISKLIISAVDTAVITTDVPRCT